MKKTMGKFEIKARRQEYMTALGILASIKEHLEAEEPSRALAYIEIWDKQYTDWLEELDLQEKR